MTEQTERKLTRIQKEKREIILSAALEVFSVHGLRGATLEKIAARAAELQKASRNDPAATGRFRCGAYVFSVPDEEASK